MEYVIYILMSRPVCALTSVYAVPRGPDDDDIHHDYGSREHHAQRRRHERHDRVSFRTAPP